MHKSLALTLLSLAGIFAADAPDPARLNELLEERRVVNMQYAADNVAWAQEDGGDFAPQLIDEEQAMGRAWDDLLRYAKEHDDVELKQIALRLEYHDELRGIYDGLNFAETDEERAELKAELAEYISKLTEAVPGEKLLAPATADTAKPERKGGAAPH